VDCRQVQQQELLERYLLGQMTDAEQESLELHYFECPRCLDELETYRALREELARRGAEIRTEPAPVRPARTWLWAPALAACAAAIVVVVWIRARPAPINHPISPVSPITQAPPPVSPDAALVELARVEPPAYTPVTLRGATGEARRSFREAMTHYQNGDCSAVLPGLRQAVRLDPSLPDADFYLGACSLLTGDGQQAIASLKATAALGDGPYLEDARYYLGKAYLRARDLSAARRELEEVVRLKGEHENEARRLLQQLAALSKDSQ